MFKKEISYLAISYASRHGPNRKSYLKSNLFAIHPSQMQIKTVSIVIEI